jgi:hypothetical protein
LKFAIYIQQLYLFSRTLPVVKPTGAGGKAARPAFRTNNDVRLTPSAAINTDRVLSPLNPAYPRTLQGRLNNFL